MTEDRTCRCPDCGAIWPAAEAEAAFQHVITAACRIVSTGGNTMLTPSNHDTTVYTDADPGDNDSEA